MEYVLSQISVGIACVLLGLSFMCKDKKRVLLLCVFSSIFFSLEFLLLRAYTGMALNIISIIRSVWFYLNRDDNKLVSLIVLDVLFVAGTVLTWNGIVSLLPLLAAIMFTYALWQHNLKIYTILEFPVSICWLMYNILMESMIGGIFELILLMFVTYGLIVTHKHKEVE